MSREMRHSGIEWIGEIPKEWSCLALLHLLKGRITDGPHETPTLQETGIPFISVDSLNDTDSVDLSVVKKFISHELYLEYQKKSHIEKGDILFSKAATIGKTAIVKDELFMVWSPLAILKPSPVVCFGKYLYYILNSEGLIKYVSLLGTNNTQINVGMRALEKAIIPKPSLVEQQKIANYLDKVCGEVDEMIALQEQMIEELKAYKQSVITEAVTKGLNPNVPMKDSGIYWIGEIPEHWGIIKMNHLCSVITDYVASGSFESLRVNVPYLDTPDYAMLVRTADLSGSARSSGKVYISEHSYNFLNNSNLFGGEIVLPNIGASVGDVYIVPKLYERMSLAPNAIMFKTRMYDNYYYYYFCSKVGKESIYNISQSTAQAKFNKTELREIRVPTPPISEQESIASYLDEKCAEIDALIAIKQAKIEELKDYKKSVIYEYVTGKKEII